MSVPRRRKWKWLVLLCFGLRILRTLLLLPSIGHSSHSANPDSRREGYLSGEVDTCPCTHGSGVGGGHLWQHLDVLAHFSASCGSAHLERADQ